MTLLRLLKSTIAQRSPVRLLWHWQKAFIAAALQGFPARKLTVVGITGTDGKTTTCGMVFHILRTAGYSAGIASTAMLQVNDEPLEKSSHLTSINPFVLQKFLRMLVKKGCTHAVVEMSSHGLVQGRTHWTFPAVAAITNLSMEHLDYHGTMEQYRADKGLLFRMLRGKGVKVLNCDDTETYSAYQRIPSERTLSFGMQGKGDLQADNMQASAAQSSANVRMGDQSTMLTLPIPGIYNVQNALCATACAVGLGIECTDALQALASFHGIPGRMERIEEGQNFSVFVDFAVSPQSYESTLKSLRAMVGTEGRVLVLCGSCGNRMKESRPMVGRICSALADIVAVTQDETYGEDPHIPWNDVWKGVDTSACEALHIFDRREAIRTLLRKAKQGDAVVFCGMGPFSTFTTLEGLIPWDEREIVREELRALH